MDVSKGCGKKDRDDPRQLAPGYRRCPTGEVRGVKGESGTRMGEPSARLSRFAQKHSRVSRTLNKRAFTKAGHATVAQTRSAAGGDILITGNLRPPVVRRARYVAKDRRFAHMSRDSVLLT